MFVSFARLPRLHFKHGVNVSILRTNPWRRGFALDAVAVGGRHFELAPSLADRVAWRCRVQAWFGAQQCQNSCRYAEGMLSVLRVLEQRWDVRRGHARHAYEQQPGRAVNAQL